MALSSSEDRMIVAEVVLA